jgi:GT2 family glycosyltransferase
VSIGTNLRAAIRAYGIGGLWRRIVELIARGDVRMLAQRYREFALLRSRAPSRAPHVPVVPPAAVPAYCFTVEAFRRHASEAIAQALHGDGTDANTAAATTRLLVLVLAARDVAGARVERTAQAVRQMKGEARVVVSDPLQALDRLRAENPAAPVLVLKAGDLPAPELPLLVAAELPRRRFVLFDLFARQDAQVLPLFLPGINYVHALNADYFRSRFIARAADLVEAARGARLFDPWQLACRILHRIYAARAWGEAAHIALPLVEIGERPDELAQERAALIARATSTPFHYLLDATPQPPDVGVSVVVCTRDRGHLLGQLVRSLLAQGGGRIGEIVIVANRTSNAYALRTLAELSALGPVRVLRYDQPFNFAAQSNLGARHCSGDLLLFVNDDIVPTSADWLCGLTEPFSNPRIGIVGPLLLYPDERVQHCGMYLGYQSGAGHALRFARLPDQDYMFLGACPRQVSVVTGAVLAIRRALFEELNGFDATFASYLQDVDLCLRAHYSEHDVVFTPRAIFLHMESASIAQALQEPGLLAQRGLEHAAFMRRWGTRLARDPFHNPNYDVGDETLTRLRPLAAPATG